jgi:hypothetical protein
MDFKLQRKTLELLRLKVFFLMRRLFVKGRDIQSLALFSVTNFYFCYWYCVLVMLWCLSLCLFFLLYC